MPIKFLLLGGVVVFFGRGGVEVPIFNGRGYFLKITILQSFSQPGRRPKTCGLYWLHCSHGHGFFWLYVDVGGGAHEIWRCSSVSAMANQLVWAMSSWNSPPPIHQDELAETQDLVGRRFAHQRFADSCESIRANRFAKTMTNFWSTWPDWSESRLHIEIRVIRVLLSLLSIFWKVDSKKTIFCSKRESIRANRPTKTLDTISNNSCVLPFGLLQEAQRRAKYRAPTFYPPKGGAKRIVRFWGGGGKRTTKCPLQNQFWRPQKVGFVWSVPVSSKENDIAWTKGGGGEIVS